MQVLPRQICRAPQVLPQAPQLFRSRTVFTQRPPHSDVGAAHAHEPPMHVSVGAHSRLQAPQLSGLVVMSTQKPPQISSDPGQRHMPALHGIPSGQELPQPPQ